MNDDETPTNDDDEPVVDETNADEPEISQVEQDAISSMGGAEGALTPNEDLLAEEENDEPAENKPEEGEATEEAEAERQTPDGTEVEEDQAGVFDDETTEDPGDFKPGDHSFTVTINGTRTKVTSLDQADQLAEDPDAFKDAKQLIRFMDKRSDMRTAIADDKKSYDEQKSKYDERQQLTEIRNERLNTWANELDYLTKRGDIPDVKADLNTAEAGLKWATDYKDEPGVKERLEIMAYMDGESKNRQAAGLPPMTSMIEAYNEMQLKNLKTDQQTQHSEDIRTRQQRGSRVAGPSPHIPADSSSGEIVGSGGTLNDLVNELLLNG